VGASGLDAAKALHGAGASLITYGVGGPDYELRPLEQLIAWRDR
jgi:hypothetical protein